MLQQLLCCCQSHRCQVYWERVSRRCNFRERRERKRGRSCFLGWRMLICRPPPPHNRFQPQEGLTAGFLSVGSSGGEEDVLAWMHMSDLYPPTQHKRRRAAASHYCSSGGCSLTAPSQNVVNNQSRSRSPALRNKSASREAKESALKWCGKTVLRNQGKRGVICLGGL